MVLALALIRLALTVAFHLDPASVGVEFSTLAVFVVPVVVASLNYGLAGGLVTAAWIAVLCIPRFIDASDRGKSSALWAEALQLVVLFGLAAPDRPADILRVEGAPTRPTRPLPHDFGPKPSTRTCSIPTGHRSSSSMPMASSSRRTGPPSVRSEPAPRRASPAGRLVDVVGAEASAVVLRRTPVRGHPA